MRTYAQLDYNAQTQAEVVARDNLLEVWLADPFHVFPPTSYMHRLLSDVADEVGPEGLREEILTDKKLREWLDAEAVERAKEALYLDGSESAESTTVIDLRDGSMFVLESVVR